jgi:arylformamidase
MQPETTLVAGGAEPELWVDQSVDYYHHLRRQGMHPSLHVLPGLNHFNVLGLYLDADGPVIRAIRTAAAAG